ncbi:MULTISPECIES: hypothetical protein [Rhizobium]|uniref:Uncharacterized protein n=1 Tax=Rhizobium paranaense TaxID=1650438 RepID=A0A7W9D007_9HYPH|nr:MULTISPECIES: hypothetical protein [Rhizobium]MBB5572316.1 hypothetical protein [Rhizobium paranaense]
MLETHSTNLAESIRFLVRGSDERRQRIVASTPTAKAPPKRRLRDRRVRERRTFYAMFAFGLLLGGLELFIVLHAL